MLITFNINISLHSFDITVYQAKKNKRYVSGNMGRKTRVGRSDIYFIFFYFFNMKVLAILRGNSKNDPKSIKI